MTRPSLIRIVTPQFVLLATLFIGFATSARSSIADEPKIALVAAKQPGVTEKPIAAGQPFQVTVEVFEVMGGEAQIQDRHLVLFKNGKIYDFALTAPRDVTVIDPSLGQVTLLSRVNHVRSVISNHDIVTNTARFRLFAKNENLEEKYGLKAKTQRDSELPNVYKIGFGDFEYEATGIQPTQPDQPALFREFTEWVARLNLVRKLGTPPFARIDLGRTVAADGLIPAGVTMTIESQNRKRTFASKYTFKTGLSEENQKRLDEVAGMMTLYREVPLPAFE